MIKTNFHTHTKRCQHAGGEDIEYIQEAINAGFITLGFSDHAPYPDDRFGLRMKYSELDEYIETMKKLKEQFKNQIQLRIGLEIEYDSRKSAYYEQLINEKGIDYLVLGQHIYVSDQKKYINTYFLENTIQYIEYAKSIEQALATGYFAFVAHPDLMFLNNMEWDDNCEQASNIIIEAANRYQTPLEFNANGLRRGIQEYSDGKRYPYPHMKFWKLVADKQIPVLINSDAHHPSNINDEYVSNASQMAINLNLNIISDYQ